MSKIYRYMNFRIENTKAVYRLEKALPIAERNPKTHIIDCPKVTEQPPSKITIIRSSGGNARYATYDTGTGN